MAAAALAQATKPLTILHVNDIHAQISPRPDGQGGFAYLKAALDKERAHCENCLVVQVGDLAQGSPVSTVFQGVPIYELANGFRFDAGTLGNHDYDYGWQKAAEFLKIANYPIVVSNIVDPGGKLAAKPFVVVERGGMKLGLIGAMTETLPGLQVPGNLGTWRVLPLVETVRKYARELRPKVDVVILLGHLIPAEEQQVVKELPEVTILLGAHMHAAMFEQDKEVGRVFTRVNASATEIGRLELQIDTAAKKVVSVSQRRIAVGRNAIAPDAEMATAVAAWEGKLAKQLDIPIGEVKRNYTRQQVKGLCEQALADEMKTDFGFCNAGGMRAALVKGELMVRHIWEVMPFDNTVVMGRFLGSQLSPAITQGRTVEPDKYYTLATNNFSAANQDRPGELGTQGLQFSDTGKLVRDVLLEWFKKKKVVE